MAGPPNYMTPRGYERIQRELHWLETEERPKVVKEVAYAASLGDRSENAEYIYGKKRLRQIDSRRGFLLKRLENAQMVDPATQKGPMVRFGATVLLAEEDGTERRWRLYGEDEVRVEDGVISWRSPVAQAILGKQEGDTARIDAPGGRRDVEIMAVSYEPCEPLPDNLEEEFKR